MTNGRAWRVGVLAFVAGGIALLAWSGSGGMLWLGSTGDVLSQFRLQAAPRMGYPLTAPVQVMERPHVVIERAAVLAAEPEITEEDAAAIARSRRLIIDKPVIAVHVGSGRSSAQAAIAGLLEPIAARIVAFDAQAMTIRGGLVKLLTGADDPEFLNDVDLQIIPQRRGSATFVGQFTYLGQRLNFNGAVTKPTSTGAENRWSVNALISSRLFEARFDGTIADEKGMRLAGSVEISVPRLRDVAHWIGVGSPRSGSLEALKLKGTLDWTGGAMAFSNATLTLDRNEGVGAITVTRVDTRTAVEGTLAFKQLDLKPYVVSAMVERKLLAPIFAATQPPAIVSLLESLDADLRISCEALVVPGLATGQGAIAVTLKDSKLLAEVAELAVEEGLFKGQFVVERVGTDLRYSLNGKLEGVEAGRILQHALGRNPLQGRADITMSLATTGDTASKLVQQLDGKATIGLRDGGRLGLDLRTLIHSVKRGELHGWQATGAAATALDEMAMTVDVRQGVMHATIIRARSSAGAISGGGYVDLTSKSLALALALTAADTAKSTPVSEILTFNGPWHVPRVAFERREDGVHRPPALRAPTLPMDRK